MGESKLHGYNTKYEDHVEVERAKIIVAQTDIGSFKLRPGTNGGSYLYRALKF